MIVKIQRPLSAGDHPGFLVYDKTGDVHTILPYSDEVKELFSDGSLKVYHNAELIPVEAVPGTHYLKINERVEDQDW